ncbi:F-box/FBD/LRR-repeat protein At1g13570-like [Chenopodium quinoa]|uniref:F-box/FBD/LRR-repeat protein At1g13570-like n=1 Tax=Chenopodium quinoa TaxID=63459 RepID=UPI000B77A9FC|nr:F-box/FBD/LRR-repeat protein At1g13570-like [Chenopodium quinoa]
MFATWIASKLKLNQKTDRISNLPQNVTQQILECLPLRDAARMSILSSHWRFEWGSISQLLLDHDLFSSILKGRLDTEDNLLAYTNFVYDILFSHAGPILKFNLYLPYWLPNEYDISQWMQYLSSNGVKEFTLEDSRSPRMNLPTCLFSCESLTHLTLIDCILSPLPATFKGFPCFVSLKLEKLYMSPGNHTVVNLFEILISKCPQLKILNISLAERLYNLTICAPKLQDLFVDYWFGNLSLEGTTNINKLSLDCYSQKYQHSNHMSDFFSNLCNVEKLILGHSFWWGVELYSLRSPTKFPEELERLRTLKIVEISLFCHSSISLVLCLFMSSPHLELLHIEATNCPRYENVHDGPLAQIDGSCFHRPYLKKIQLIGISELINGLLLMKFLLACSPALEEMTVELINFIEEAMQYRRASPIAKINIMPKKETDRSPIKEGGRRGGWCWLLNLSRMHRALCFG